MEEQSRQFKQSVYQLLLERLTSIDERLERIEAAQDVTARVYHSHGAAIARIENRCLEALGQACSILHGGNGGQSG